MVTRFNAGFGRYYEKNSSNRRRRANMFPRLRQDYIQITDPPVA